VAHAVSASYFRSDHMSPPAMAMAVLLHASVALALWWMSTHQRPETPPLEAIEVSIERPKPPEPPPPAPPPRPTPQSTQPVRPFMPPPADIISNKPTQVPSTIEQWQQQALPPQPPAATEPAPATPAAAVPPPPPQQHKPIEFPKPPPLPQVQTPAPPAPPPPAAKPPPPPQTQPRPSPLAPQPHRPSPNSQAAVPAPSPLVNPADVVNRGRAQDVYLWQVVRKVMNYHYQASANVEQGTTVARITIARDGRLLEASIAISSGYPQLDKGVLDGLRAGSPYAPLPPEIPGASATFNLPLVSRHR
jgi:TonB family protein